MHGVYNCRFRPRSAASARREGNPGPDRPADVEICPEHKPKRLPACLWRLETELNLEACPAPGARQSRRQSTPNGLRRTVTPAHPDPEAARASRRPMRLGCLSLAGAGQRQRHSDFDAALTLTYYSIDIRGAHVHDGGVAKPPSPTCWCGLRVCARQTGWHGPARSGVSCIQRRVDGHWDESRAHGLPGMARARARLQDVAGGHGKRENA